MSTILITEDKVKCPVEEQGLLYHMVTKWSLSTKAISMLNAHFKKGMTASELSETLKLHNSKIPSAPRQNMPKGKRALFIPIYSNTSRNQIQKDAANSALQHQKYFLSFRYFDEEKAFVLIQRSNANDYVRQRQIDQQRIHDRHLTTYYKQVDVAEL